MKGKGVVQRQLAVDESELFDRPAAVVSNSQIAGAASVGGGMPELEGYGNSQDVDLFEDEVRRERFYLFFLFHNYFQRPAPVRGGGSKARPSKNV